MYKILTRQEYREELSRALKDAMELYNSGWLLKADGTRNDNQINIIKDLIKTDLVYKPEELMVYYKQICIGNNDNPTLVLPQINTRIEFYKLIEHDEQLLSKINDLESGNPLQEDDYLFNLKAAVLQFKLNSVSQRN